MNKYKLIPLALKTLIIEVLGLITIIIFKPLSYISNNTKYQYFLIGCLNIIFYPFVSNFRKLRKTQESLESFRKQYDSGIYLFNKVLGKNWQKEKDILDIGCGLGKLLEETVNKGAHYGLGTDLAKRNIDIANKYKKLHNISNIDFKSISTSEIIQMDIQFDYIISHTVFEHIEKNLLLPILNDIEHLLKKGGIAAISYNHYNDIYGSHLKAFISHPWPQLIFDEQIIFNYWTEKLHSSQKKGEMMYFPKEYTHGTGKGNKDCFMNLNKLNISDFEKIISQSNIKLEKKVLYSKSMILRIFPFLYKIKYIRPFLEGSAVYILKK